MAVTPFKSSDNFNMAGFNGKITEADNTYVAKTGDSMSGALSMGNNKITDVASPTSARDAATKEYVDGIVPNTMVAIKYVVLSEGEYTIRFADSVGYSPVPTGTLYAYRNCAILRIDWLGSGSSQSFNGIEIKVGTDWKKLGTVILGSVSLSPISFDSTDESANLELYRLKCGLRFSNSTSMSHSDEVLKFFWFCPAPVMRAV